MKLITKILSLGTLVTSGVLTGVLVPVLNKKEDNKEQIKEFDINSFETLLNSVSSNDFNIPNKEEIFPSQYEDQKTLINQLKNKAKTIKEMPQLGLEKFFNEKVEIIFISNDLKSTLEFKIKITNVKFNNVFTITGFKSWDALKIRNIKNANAQIDAEVARKTKPKQLMLFSTNRKIIVNNKTKIPDEYLDWKILNTQVGQLSITPHNKKLHSEILDWKFLDENLWENLVVGSKIQKRLVEFDIKVTSWIPGTKEGRYKVTIELHTFTTYLKYLKSIET